MIEANRSRTGTTEPVPALVELLMTLSAFHRALIPRHSLSLGQYISLRFIATHEPVRISALARMFVVAPPTATTFVDGMERRGWIRRERSATDRRAVTLKLTPKARRTLRQIDAALERFFEGAFARLPPSRRRASAAAIAELGRSLETELSARQRAGRTPAP